MIETKTCASELLVLLLANCLPCPAIFNIYFTNLLASYIYIGLQPERLVELSHPVDPSRFDPRHSTLQWQFLSPKIGNEYITHKFTMTFADQKTISFNNGGRYKGVILVSCESA